MNRYLIVSIYLCGLVTGVGVGFLACGFIHPALLCFLGAIMLVFLCIQEILGN